MWVFYVLAFIPIIIGGILYYLDKEIQWYEWLVGSATAFLLAGIFNCVAIHGMTSDTETWSGTVTSAHRTPYWYAEWTEIKTREVDDGNGKSHTETYTETQSEHHYPFYSMNTTIGSFGISESKYNELKQKFGKETSHPGSRPHYHSGDKNDYNLENVKNWIQPITDTRSWSNRVKAAPTVFSYKAVPNTAPVFEYPKNNDSFVSDRLLGPNAISILDWDRMNARLGSSYKVNVIMVNIVESADADLMQLQEAKWIGGKKNDMVLCYSGNPGKPAKIAHVFSWSESDLCKKNLETILLKNNINDSIIPLIEKEIQTNYKIKDWSKFDYIDIEVPLSVYIWYLVLMCIVQTSLYITFHHSDMFEKEEKFGIYYRRR